MGKIIENYSLQDILGQGVYGKVYKGVNMVTKEQVAVKVIKASKFKQIPKLEECTVNEINTLTKIEENPHIVRYIDMLKTVNNFYFVYQFCNGGTLEKMMANYRNTPEKVMPQNKAVGYFNQIVDAFRTLSKFNIMHRDLKPENILLHNGLIKIADFGFCKSLTNPQDLAQTMLGSPIYMAPEVLKGEIYTIKADIWSLGVVFYEMLFGHCPFQSNSIAKLIQILDVTEVVIPKTTNPNIEKILRRMLVKDASKRADWNQLFEFRANNNVEGDDVKAKINSATTLTSGMTPMDNGSSRNLVTRNTSGTLGSGTWNESQDYNYLSRKKSPPNQISNLSNYNLRNTLSANNNNGAHQTNLLSKSPITDKNTNPEQIVDKILSGHRKAMGVSRLLIQVQQVGTRNRAIIGYLVCKSIQRELAEMSQLMKKELERVASYMSAKYKQCKRIVDKELQDMRVILANYRDQLSKENINQGNLMGLQNNKNKHLKTYVEGLKLDVENQMELYIHAYQLLDFFEDSIYLKKDSYQRLTKEQLSRQIAGKIAKL